MSLQIINNKEVRGTDFSVKVPNIHQVIYTEANHMATVEIEGGLDERGQVNWIVYRDTLSGWVPPDPLDTIDKKKRDAIISNIGQSLNLLNMPHQIL